ncbi:MAG TPA: Trk system potassium transporter TrkA [Clostridiaceae bacterium]|jgi:trk system potassium uptake protein TrkA|nr:Trk system potassium transporter TrkA [Clostridiaceae bacterium]
MKIVVAGAGKVGEVLCRELVFEDHEITLIELDEKRLDSMIGMYDITGVLGSGSLEVIQREADVPDCDIFIAVTPDDETNLIAAITAKSLGARFVIARVRSPEYSKQMSFLRETLGISVMINPELEAAREVMRGMRFPEALSVEPFANGLVHIVEYVLPEDSELAGLKLREVGRKHGDVLICMIIRDEEIIIPHGFTTLEVGDHLFITGRDSEILRFMSAGRNGNKRIKSALLIGGGRITRYLLPRLERYHIRSKVIEVDEDIAEQLAADFPRVEVVLNDGTRQSVLHEENAENYDAVIAVTGVDEENILINLYAAHVGVRKTVTKVNRTDLLTVLKDAGLKSILTPYRIISNQIVRLVRSMANSEGSNIEAFYSLADGRVEILQFRVAEGNQVSDIPLIDLDTKPGLLIACIVRGDEIIYPRGDTCIQLGDEIVIVSTHPRFDDVNDILANGRAAQ